MYSYLALEKLHYIYVYIIIFIYLFYSKIIFQFVLPLFQYFYQFFRYNFVYIFRSEINSIKVVSKLIVLVKIAFVSKILFTAIALQLRQ